MLGSCVRKSSLTERLEQGQSGLLRPGGYLEDMPPVGNRPAPHADCSQVLSRVRPASRWLAREVRGTGMEAALNPEDMKSSESCTGA